MAQGSEVWIGKQLIGGVSRVDDPAGPVWVALPLCGGGPRTFRRSRDAERWLRENWVDSAAQAGAR
ncbi:MAG: hypothetical protein R3F60_19405 [bacterium]